MYRPLTWSYQRASFPRDDQDTTRNEYNDKSSYVSMAMYKIHRDSATAFHGHCVWSIWLYWTAWLSPSYRVKMCSGKRRWLHVKDIGNNGTVASETGRDLR
ncbi:hypothetical protein ARMSODRAFT_978351 [Armillaria solidipes]|uniref:Uncharacterized protein n=1 Tax=Armillaria solidipes TaxID=1076256 RepID=A0A2H3BQ71_9AGAR|nr:hypothetical protein ARMSODRAFT_978351 [Armillaria solidipes]